MRLEWLFIAIPSLIMLAVGDDKPEQVLPTPPAVSTPAPADDSILTSEWAKRIEYDVNLCHANFHDASDRIGKLQAEIDELKARCKCANANQPATKPAPTNALPPLTFPPRAAAQPVRSFVKKCVNGVCTLVPVPATSSASSATTSTSTETCPNCKTTATTTTRTWETVSTPRRFGILRRSRW